jgi:glycosyltransferase involved in cell wall biosynthesis
MSLGVSIVICCYNSAERLPQTLGFLAAQRLPETTPWEVLVIDNASSDNTAEVATKCWPISSPAPLRVVREPNPGTGNARFRSFSEARHEILVFLDDDNWIDETWVARAINFFERPLSADPAAPFLSRRSPRGSPPWPLILLWGISYPWREI